MIAEDYRDAVQTNYNTVFVVNSAPEKFLANEWAFCQVFQSSGTTLALNSVNGSYSWFQATWVAAL